MGQAGPGSEPQCEPCRSAVPAGGGGGHCPGGWVGPSLLHPLGGSRPARPPPHAAPRTGPPAVSQCLPKLWRDDLTSADLGEEEEGGPRTGRGTEHVGSGELRAGSRVSRDPLFWDPGGRQGWCLEGGDLISETADTTDAPHPGPPRLLATPGGPSAPPSCRAWERAWVWGATDHRYTHEKLRLGSLLTLRHRTRGKGCLQTQGVCAPRPGPGWGAGSPIWGGPSSGQALVSPAASLLHLTRSVSLPAPLHWRASSPCPCPSAGGPVTAAGSRPPAFGFCQSSRGLKHRHPQLALPLPSPCPASPHPPAIAWPWTALFPGAGHVRADG